MFPSRYQRWYDYVCPHSPRERAFFPQPLRVSGLVWPLNGWLLEGWGPKAHATRDGRDLGICCLGLWLPLTAMGSSCLRCWLPQKLGGCLHAEGQQQGNSLPLEGPLEVA